MKRRTPFLSTQRLSLKRGTFNDYMTVYEYDFCKLRDIAGEFTFEKLDVDLIDGFDTYADECNDVYDWIIYTNITDTPIGNIIADRFDNTSMSIELSFNLHPNYWGNGYIKEASIAVMDFLFSNDIEKIFCTYSEGNKKSKRVIEKIGFEPYKVIKDAWEKDGIMISDYKNIITKQKFYELYCKDIKT